MKTTIALVFLTFISISLSAQRNWTKGSDSSKITITVQANVPPASREAQVIISIAGVKSDTIFIKQDGAPAFLLTHEKSLKLGAPDGSKESLYVYSNVNWTATSNKTWLTIENASDQADAGSIVSASDTAKLYIIVSANLQLKERQAQIVITGPGVDSDTVFITQEGSPPHLTVSDEFLTLSDHVSSIPVKFSIFSNVNWSITGSESWLTFDKTSGSDTASIVVTASSKTSGDQRTAYIIVSGEGVKSDSIKVTQLPDLTGVSILKDQFSFYPVPFNKSLVISSSKPYHNAMIFVYSVNGSQIYSSKLNDRFTEIDMSNIDAGTYLVKIVMDEGVITRKIEKR